MADAETHILISCVGCRFQTAAGKIPLDALRAGSCGEELLHSTSQLCEIDEDSPNVIGQQFLFSIYMHPAVGFAGDFLKSLALKLVAMRVRVWLLAA